MEIQMEIGEEKNVVEKIIGRIEPTKHREQNNKNESLLQKNGKLPSH